MALVLSICYICYLVKYKNCDFTFVVGSDWLQQANDLRKWESKDPKDPKGEKTIISEAGRKYKELEDFYYRRDGGRDVIRLLDANRSTLLFGNNHLNRKYLSNHPLHFDNTVGIMKLDQKFNFLFDKEFGFFKNKNYIICHKIQLINILKVSFIFESISL